MSNKKGIVVLSLFDGMSGGQIALNRLGVKVDKYYASEVDKYTIAVTQHNYPNTIQLGDVTKWEEWDIDWRNIDLVIGGSPCFPVGTKIICRNEIKDISDMSVGDEVLTHTGEYKRVLKVGCKISQTYKLLSQSSTGTITTGNHPYYVRIKNNSTGELGEPAWVRVENITHGDCVGTPIIKTESNPYKITDDEAFVIGMYIGDGHTRKDYRRESGRENHRHWQLILSVGSRKSELLKETIRYGYSEYKHTKGTNRIVFSSKRLVEYVERNCGSGAENKMFGKEILDLPAELLQRVIDGYLFADGSYRNNTYRATTVSKMLAETLTLAVAKVYGVTTSVEFTKRPKKYVIEGRVVNQKDTWTISFRKRYKKIGLARTIDGVIWNPVKKIHKTNVTDVVYNLEVEDDNSYVANNHIVHNCQGLSSSGKGDGLLDHRSKLFFDWIDIRNYAASKNPNIVFLLENVIPRKKEWTDNMTNEVGVDPIMIDSRLLSAQSRKRLYWTNIPDIQQPEDRHIYLQNIVESGSTDSTKSYCIDANYFRGGNLKQYFEKSRRQLVFDSPVQVGYINKNHRGGRVYDLNGKSVTLTSSGGGWGMKTGLYIMNNPTWAAERVRYDKNGKSFVKTELREDEKANALLAKGRDKSLLAEPVVGRTIGRRVNKNGIRDDCNQNLEFVQMFEPRLDGKSGTITTVQKDNVLSIPSDTASNDQDRSREWIDLDRNQRQEIIKGMIESGDIAIRMLTPTECERLQTLSDGYTALGNFDGKVKEVSKSQRYKMIGNGWTVDVIAHIFSFIPQIKNGEWIK